MPNKTTLSELHSIYGELKHVNSPQGISAFGTDKMDRKDLDEFQRIGGRLLSLQTTFACGIAQRLVSPRTQVAPILKADAKKVLMELGTTVLSLHQILAALDSNLHSDNDGTNAEDESRNPIATYGGNLTIHSLGVQNAIEDITKIEGLLFSRSPLEKDIIDRSLLSQHPDKGHPYPYVTLGYSNSGLHSYCIVDKPEDADISTIIAAGAHPDAANRRGQLHKTLLETACFELGISNTMETISNMEHVQHPSIALRQSVTGETSHDRKPKTALIEFQYP